MDSRTNLRQWVTELALAASKPTLQVQVEAVLPMAWHPRVGTSLELQVPLNPIPSLEVVNSVLPHRHPSQVYSNSDQSPNSVALVAQAHSLAVRPVDQQLMILMLTLLLI